MIALVSLLVGLACGLAVGASWARRPEVHEALDEWRHWARTETGEKTGDWAVREMWSARYWMMRQRLDGWREWAGADEDDPDNEVGDAALRSSMDRALEESDGTGKLIREAMKAERHLAREQQRLVNKTAWGAAEEDPELMR